jgi:hypothetical protein
MKVQPTAAPALPTMKMNADGPPNTIPNKSSEELELLKRIIEESKVFRRPASGKGQQPAKVKRKRRCGHGGRVRAV